MPKYPRILVVARQTTLGGVVARLLLPRGYRIEVASSAKRTHELIGKQHFDAAVIGLSALATFDSALLDEVRSTIPSLVVLATAVGDADRIALSFPEAAICAAEPLDQEKLLALLESLIPPQTSVHQDACAEPMRFAGCTLDLGSRIFTDAERREVALTRGECALLAVLAGKAGQVMSRAQLRNAMDGGSTNPYDRSVDMLVARLRRKIQPDPAKPQLIVTVQGTGYKFVSPVRKAEAGLAPSTTFSNEGAAKPVERRQLTVLSCQIIGFAALATRSDPEDLESAIRPVYAACGAIIARFGGTMVRALGDGVLGYFGYPKAHENDAQRAVRAALEMLRVVCGIEAAPIGHFRARIGIATGQTLVGELSATGIKEQAAVGEAVNLALHLQKAASAQSLLIAAKTRDLIGRFFQCHEVEPIELEVEHQSAPAWRVVDEIAGIPRFEALRREGMLDLVGREAEVDRLLTSWSQTLRGSGQVVLLTGEAGIGKSRLAIELEERLMPEPHASLQWSGLPHRVEAPMSVLIDELQVAAGFAKADTPQQKLEKIRNIFASLGTAEAELGQSPATVGFGVLTGSPRHLPAAERQPGDATRRSATAAVPLPERSGDDNADGIAVEVTAPALIAELLGLPRKPPDASQLSPHKRKARIFEALLARIAALALRQPVFAVVEDVHWVDPTSLEFFALLVERASAMRLLLLVIGRPEFVPPWAEHSYLTKLTLSRLSRSDSTALVQQVAGGRRIPQSIEADIVSRADGVPLFVEELTKSLLESTDGGGGMARGSASTSIAAIPATLEGLLLTRLDQLACGSEVAQAGAVIGREFSVECLRAITGLDERALTAALDQLVASGLIFRRGLPPETTCIFKHALVREAAYGTLLRERRQALHGSVARTYEERLPETAEAEPELLAHHWREAGDSIRAVSYLLKAAERALQRSATPEALSQLAQARELISKPAESRARLQLELKLEITQARALLAARGYTAPETREAYRGARERCEALGDDAQLPLIIHGQWLGAWMSADHHAALDQARELYLWGERNHDQVGLAMAHSDLGMVLTTLGRLVEARDHLQQALQINKFALPGRPPFVASNVDGRISALSFMQHCLLLLGFPDRAKAAGDEAASLNPQNLYSQVLAAVRVLRTRVFARDPDAVAESSPAVVRLTQQQGYPYFVGTAMIFAGWAQVQLGDVEAGIDVCERGLTQLQNLGGRCWWPLYLALLADCHQHAGDLNHAVAFVEQSLQSVETTGERLWESEIYRLKGKLLERRGDADAAVNCFATALQKARTQQARLLELRAAVSFAALLKQQHRFIEARETLAPVYASFSEGFDFIDLREAKALLDTLAQSLAGAAAHSRG